MKPSIFRRLVSNDHGIDSFLDTSSNEVGRAIPFFSE